MKELNEILEKLGLKIRKEYDMFNRLIYVVYYENHYTTGIYTVIKGSCKEVKKFIKRKYESELQGFNFNKFNTSKYLKIKGN